MSSREFVAHTFRCLYQINMDANALPVDMKVAVAITCFTNEDEGGRAWPSSKTIGGKCGLSERTVLRSVRRLQELGYLRVEWGKPGRKHQNQYWLIEKTDAVSTPLHASKKTGTAAPVLCVEKTGTVTPVSNGGKPASGVNKPASGVKQTGAAAPENHSTRTTEGNHTRARPPKNGGASADGQNREGASEVADAMARFWSVYPKQVDRLATEKAFAKALKSGATAEQIIEGAGRYARDPQRIARGERYTKHPANWLRDGGWSNPVAGVTIDEHGNHIATPGAEPLDDIDAMVNSILATGFRINSHERN